MKLMRRNLLFAAVASVAVGLSGTAWAQAFPTKPITLIVPFAAGGPTDVVARTVAVSMSKSLGQTIIVENKLGAGGTIAANYVAKATPDGYTILIHHNGMATAPALYRKLPFNPLTDFEYIGQVLDVPMTLLARKDLPPNNLAELTAYVKANAKTINLANAGLGAVSHLCGMLFQRALGVELTTVPFQGTAPALNALLGGQIDYVCDQTVGVVPSIQAKAIHGLVVAVPARLSVIPDVPTSIEQGLPEFQAVGWNALFAPKGTPKDIVDRLNTAGRAALNDDNAKKRLLELAVELPPESQTNPAGLREFVSNEIEKWVPVIKKSGVVGQ